MARIAEHARCDPFSSGLRFPRTTRSGAALPTNSRAHCTTRTGATPRSPRYIPSGIYLRYTQPVDEDLGLVLERLVVGSVAITARAIATADAELTFMQWRVLLVVGEREEGQAVGEIAARIGAHASPASRVVSRLKRRGLVSTDKGDVDKRVVCVRLTDSGRDLRARVLAQRGRDIAQVVATASITPAEAEAVAELARSFEPFA